MLRSKRRVTNLAPLPDEKILPGIANAQETDEMLHHSQEQSIIVLHNPVIEQ